MSLGFTSPLSPLGKSNIVGAPPWHIAGDVIAFEFWTDPLAVAATLPPGLAPDANSNGRAIAAFADWQFTTQHDELLDPARYQCREFFVLVDARWNDMPVVWMPYAFTDNDVALARGWLEGSPVRLGSIFQTRSFPAPGPAAAAIAPGARFGTSLSVNGQRLANGLLTLKRDGGDVSPIFRRPIVRRRYFPNLTAARQAKPAIDELVQAVHEDLVIVDVWEGEASVDFPPAIGEEIHAIAPIRSGEGYRFSMSFSVGDLVVLQDFTR
jgi:hypothetical protein